jgi:hypothetical protein
MQLYTFNATPVHVTNDTATNAELVKDYPQQVAAILAAYGFDGFTIYPVAGYWQGVAEGSFKIELAAEPKSVISDKLNIIETIAAELRDVYKQDSVMVTYPDNSVTFI